MRGVTQAGLNHLNPILGASAHDAPFMVRQVVL